MGCNQSKQEARVDRRIWDRIRPFSKPKAMTTKEAAPSGDDVRDGDWNDPAVAPEISAVVQDSEDESKTQPPEEAPTSTLSIAANIRSALGMDGPTSVGNASQIDNGEEASERLYHQPKVPCPDPREQILTYFKSVSTVSEPETVADSEFFGSTTSLVSIEEDLSTLQPEQPTSESSHPASMFTVWRPTSAEAIRKMVEGEGVGKGLDIKGKSSKAGVLSGYVPYLQIHEEEHKSKVKTIDRGGRTRIFFATQQARDAVLEDLGPLQNHMFNVVQDAKRTVKHSVMQVLYVPHHAKKKVKKVGKVAKKTAVKTAVIAGNSVSQATTTVSSSVFTAGNAVRSGANKGFAQAGDSVSKFSRRASTGVTSAGEVISNLVSPVSNSVRRVTMHGGIVSTFTNPIADGVKKGVTTVTGTVSKGVTNAGGGVIKGVTAVSDTVSKGVITAGGGVVKGVTTVTDTVSKGVTTAGGGVIKGVTTITGTVSKGVTTAGGGVMKGVTTVTGTVSKGVTTAGGGVMKGVTTVSGNVSKSASTISIQATNTAMVAASTIARPMGISSGDGEDDEVEWALKRLLWDMDDPSVRKIDDYSPQCYGIELPDRLLWQAFVADSDISRPEDSKWYTARQSQPAFQDMNLIAISKSRKNQKKKKKKKKKKYVSDDQLVVLWQTCTGNGDDDNPMDPRGLVMAYEENGRVLPVVSDFDCFLMGSKEIRYDVLPEEQVKLLDWCVSNIEDVLERQKSSKDATWTDRWLHVLKSSTSKGFHPEIPKYGFGDAKSYSIVENAVKYLGGSGAVRHGAECFNFYFPQDLDDEFLIVSETLPDEPKWRYVSEDELLDFLFERVNEGYTFPLNPKWVLCDHARWKELFDCLRTSQESLVHESIEAWVPKAVQDKIESIRSRHPDGFVSDKPKDDEICGTEAMDLAMLDIDRLIIFRRARNKLWIMGIFLKLLRTVRARHPEIEYNKKAFNDESNDEESSDDDSINDESNFEEPPKTIGSDEEEDVHGI